MEYDCREGQGTQTPFEPPLSPTYISLQTYRAIQYFARFLAWLLLSRGHKIEAARWNALKNHLALGRKLMRVGKPWEHLQSAMRAAQRTDVPAAETITTMGRQVAYFGYLTNDMFVWVRPAEALHGVGLTGIGYT